MPSTRVWNDIHVFWVCLGGEVVQSLGGTVVLGDYWGTLLAGVMCGRCNRITTVAEERFSRLVNATPEDFWARPSGRLFVGSCGDAVQWAGYRHELSMDSQWWAVGHHRSTESSVQ